VISPDSGASAVTSRTTASSREIDALWLDALYRLVGRSAHELKGALNGVSVNQEVIRSRAEKANTMAASLSSFAAVAAEQLDMVISLTEALLGLTRRAEATDVGVEVRRIAILLGAAARSDGKQLTLDDAAALSALGVTSAPVSAVRLAICESLLAAVEANTTVRCMAVADPRTPVIRIESSDGNAMTVQSEIVIAAGDAGITIRAEPSAVSISFPR
jgi:signal transduction histidine kinase